MTPDYLHKLELDRNIKRYNNLYQYLQQIQRSGKVFRLTRSQINAIRNRISRCIIAIQKYLKLTALCAFGFIMLSDDLDAQCRMNRLPISNQSSFQTFIGHSSSPVLTDIDLDGDFDLVVGHKYGGILLYENRANFFKPSYGLLNPFDGLGVYLDASPAFVDIDGDGDLDVFIGEVDKKVHYFRNENGAFTEVTGPDNPFDGIAEFEYAAPTFVDIDNDDDPDAFIGAGDGKVYFFRNDNGVFAEITGSGNPLNNFDVGLGVTCKPAFVDFDQDDDLDVFIGIGDGKIQYYRNDNGSFVTVTGSSNPFNNIDVGDRAAPTFADMDSDGDQDAIVGNFTGDINFFRNVNGLFVREADDNSPLGEARVDGNAAPHFGDLDGDGDDDAVIGQNDGTLRAFVNNNGTFSELIGSGNPFNGFDVGDYAKPVLVDLDPTDSDTDLDLVVGNGDGKIVYFRNTNGSFTRLFPIFNPLQSVDVSGHAAPAFVDFDGDNDKDAFIGANDGTIHYYRNDNGSFTQVNGPGNPFNGIDAGHRAVPSFMRFSTTTVYVGLNNGTVKEYRKSGDSYVLVSDSAFLGVDAGSFVAPGIVDFGVVIGNRNGGLFVFKDQGGRSNVWNGPFTNHWHSQDSNWELMTIPKSGCDDVHVLNGTILRIDPSQSGESRTITVRDGGQFEVKSGAELSIIPK